MLVTDKGDGKTLVNEHRKQNERERREWARHQPPHPREWSEGELTRAGGTVCGQWKHPWPLAAPVLGGELCRAERTRGVLVARTEVC